MGKTVAMIKKFLVSGVSGLVTLALCGCALSGGQVGSPPALSEPFQAGTLVISRDGSWVGLFGTMRVRIDQRDLYRLGLNQRYSTQLDPGEHLLSYSIGLNDCASIIRIKPRETLHLRLTPICTMERL